MTSDAKRAAANGSTHGGAPTSRSRKDSNCPPATPTERARQSETSTGARPDKQAPGREKAQTEKMNKIFILFGYRRHLRKWGRW